MAKLHDLVLVHGAAKALEMATGSKQERLVRIAAEILAEENQALGITYSGFCLTSLPHKRLADDEIWQRTGRNISLLVEPVRVHANGAPRFLGVPFGSRARLILLYLQTEASRNNSREVELGKSMRDWLKRMDIGIGGKSYRDVKEQASRIGACRLTFKWQSADGRSQAWDHDHIVKGGFAFQEADDEQGTLWTETVRLGETFYEELRRHPVPIFEPALRHIANQSLTIDVYIWLAYRLHSLTKPTIISWPALKDQFGQGYAQIKPFRQRFLQALEMAIMVYPRARVDVAAGGLMLHPSPPPIERRRYQVIASTGPDEQRSKLEAERCSETAT